MPRKVYGCIIGANTIPAHDRCREKGISLSELPVTKPNSHASVASRKRSSDINTNHPSSTWIEILFPGEYIFQILLPSSETWLIT